MRSPPGHFAGPFIAENHVCVNHVGKVFRLLRSIPSAFFTPLSLRHQLGECLMFVRCQSLARCNLLPRNEYFANINVVSLSPPRSCASLFAQSFASIVE